MKFLYLNNFRGFSKTLVPIPQCTFLVGENSTGKSSLLYTLRTITGGGFEFFPQFTEEGGNAPLEFGDLVSAGSTDRSCFDVGLAVESTTKDGKKTLLCTIYRFREKSGLARLEGYVQLKSGTSLCIHISKKGVKFKSTQISDDSGAIGAEASTAIIQEQIAKLDEPQSGYDALPAKPFAEMPLGILLSSLKARTRGESLKSIEFSYDLMGYGSASWIAPIRARPQRIHYGHTKEYSDEGAHAPFVLRQKLKSKSFVSALREFGESSGLFKILSTHTFGKGKKNPFEVMVRFRDDVDLSISNVGYGVSQVLPLIVEFLSRPQKRTFAVQQPEVHLHPRAQAALGTLLFQLSSHRGHSFIVETHSDYLIDRFRLEMSKSLNPPDSQVLFFSRSDKGNQLLCLPIAPSGRYPSEQPKEFRDFFVKEEMSLLSI